MTTSVIDYIFFNYIGDKILLEVIFGSSDKALEAGFFIIEKPHSIMMVNDLNVGSNESNKIPRTYITCVIYVFFVLFDSIVLAYRQWGLCILLWSRSAEFYVLSDVGFLNKKTKPLQI